MCVCPLLLIVISCCSLTSPFFSSLEGDPTGLAALPFIRKYTHLVNGVIWSIILASDSTTSLLAVNSPHTTSTTHRTWAPEVDYTATDLYPSAVTQLLSLSIRKADWSAALLRLFGTTSILGQHIHLQRYYYVSHDGYDYASEHVRTDVGRYGASRVRHHEAPPQELINRWRQSMERGRGT